MAAAGNPSLVASASPLTDVEEELQCPICMEYLTDPVTLDCGHNFCKSCITCYCETWEDLGDLECPLCKKRIKKGNLRPNWLLANIVEKIKLLPCNPGREDLCVRHKEKLHLFCKEDNKLVCLFCERSPEHRSHTVLLLEEAAQEYKADFQDHVRTLVKQQERLLELKLDTKKESQDMLKQVKAEKKAAVTEFRQLHRFLEEQEKLLVAEMEEVEKQIETRRDKQMTRLSEELSSLESLIQEMQEKLHPSHQSASEFLKNVGCTMQKWKARTTRENPEFPSGLISDEFKFSSLKFSAINSFLEGEIKRFKGSLQSKLKQYNATTTPGSEELWSPLFGHRKSVSGGGKYIYHDHQGRVPSFSEWQQPSREDTVRREENTRGGLSTNQLSAMLRICRSVLDYKDSSFSTVVD